MQILSYPVGLLIGLFPIAVDLGETRAPAHLFLDSRPVCEVTVRSPGCTVDLGPDPRVHLLELVRTDPVGHVTERVHRWINRPGIEPEVLVAGGCDEKRHDCEFDVTWAHPGKLDPKRISLQLDGATVWQGPGHHAKIPRGSAPLPQVVVADAQFPDGTRATYSRTLYSFYPEEAQASLLAVPIVPAAAGASNEELTTALKAADLPTRVVEETDPEVTFVVAEGAFDTVPSAMSQAMANRLYVPRLSPAEGSTAFDSVRVLFPDESLLARGIPLNRLGTVQPVARARFSRYADAVAAAGYALGGTPRRRAVVLVLSGFDRPNVSSFSAAQAQAYLAEVMVPLYVWRIGGVEAPEWPEGPHLTTAEGVQAALRTLRSEMDRQRIAWLEGFRDTRYLGRWLAPGLALAGRNASSLALPDLPSVVPASAGPVLRAGGPDGGPVHALASAPGGSISYAGTHAGVFRSRDGGAHWEWASAGLPAGPVWCLAANPARPAVVYAGTSAGLSWSEDAGAKWSRSGGQPSSLRVASLALDPSNPRVLYVGAEGAGVLRSDDAGRTLLASSMTYGDARALAVEPAGRSLFAATETGVYRSNDRGMTWTRAGKLPARALALAFEKVGDGERLLAGTAGAGLFVSADAGATWSKSKLGAAFVTSVRVDAATGTILAGSPSGVFSSPDGGVTWTLARVGEVESLAPGGGPAALAGGARGVFLRAAPGAIWRESNAGLSAQVVYSVAASKASLYAATSTGLLRASGSAAGWSPVGGIPDGVAAYALALTGAAGSEFLVGTSGDIGRSFDRGGSWSWSPTNATFSFVVDRSRPSRALAATRDGVLKSDDGGLHWDPSASGLEKTFALQLGEDARDPSVVYAATAGAGVFRSSNGARSWNEAGWELSRMIVRSIAVDPGAADVVYAGTDAGVFRSVNRGEDWSPLMGDLPRAPVYALLTDARARGTIFAGTAAGIFRSRDGGTSWSAFPLAGVPAVVTSLSIDVSRNVLVAGTLGAGVFVVPLGE